MIAALALAAATPQQLALGREVAEAGLLASLGKLVAPRETEEIIAAHPELSEAEKAAFRQSAAATAARLKERIVSAEATSYATRLSESDLRAIVAWNRSEAAKRYRAALPQLFLDTLKTVGNVDFKGDAQRDFCRSHGKLCPPAGG